MINRRYEMGTYPIDYVGGECLTRGGNCGCDSCLAQGAGFMDDLIYFGKNILAPAVSFLPGVGTALATPLKHLDTIAETLSPGYHFDRDEQRPMEIKYSQQPLHYSEGQKKVMALINKKKGAGKVSKGLKKAGLAIGTLAIPAAVLAHTLTKPSTSKQSKNEPKYERYDPMKEKPSGIEIIQRQTPHGIVNEYRHKGSGLKEFVKKHKGKIGTAVGLPLALAGLYKGYDAVRNPYSGGMKRKPKKGAGKVGDFFKKHKGKIATAVGVASALAPLAYSGYKHATKDKYETYGDVLARAQDRDLINMGLKPYWGQQGVLRGKPL